MPKRLTTEEKQRRFDRIVPILERRAIRRLRAETRIGQSRVIPRHRRISHDELLDRIDRLREETCNARKEAASLDLDTDVVPMLDHLRSPLSRAETLTEEASDYAPRTRDRDTIKRRAWSLQCSLIRLHRRAERAARASEKALRRALERHKGTGPLADVVVGLTPDELAAYLRTDKDHRILRLVRLGEKIDRIAKEASSLLRVEPLGWPDPEVQKGGNPGAPRGARVAVWLTGAAVALGLHRTRNPTTPPLSAYDAVAQALRHVHDTGPAIEIAPLEKMKLTYDGMKWTYGQCAYHGDLERLYVDGYAWGERLCWRVRFQGSPAGEPGP